MANISDELRAYYESYKAKFEREQAQADKLEAEAKEIKARIAQRQARIKAGPQDARACPQCFIESGQTNIVISRPADNPDKFDRWGCPQCGFYFDLQSGMR